MENDSDSILSEYMQELVGTEFPQFSILNRRRFERFLEARGLRVTQEDLEHFEKIGFLYPILRLKRPKIIEKNGKQRYAGISEDAYMFRKYLEKGMLEFPSSTNFRPWEEYKDGYHEKMFIYYHPYQILLIDKFLDASSINVTSVFLEEVTDFEKVFRNFKKIHEMVKKSFLRSKPRLVRRIGLLLLLQNAYQPQCTKVFHPDPRDDESYKKWYEWRKNKFSAKTVLEKSGLTISEVKEWRDYLAGYAMFHDPLARWYRLVHLVSHQMKEKLKGKALLTQDYYVIVRMLNKFLEDLTGEKQLEPDDITDGLRGKWKKDYYGKEFDYEDTEIQRKIIEDYMTIPRSKVIILVEGDTEEISIPILAEAMGIQLKKMAIRLYNFEGVGGITVQNAGALLQVTNLEGTGSYLIIDKDENAEENVNELVRRGLLKENHYRIWSNDFEEDNFGRELVLRIVNERLTSYGFDEIESGRLNEEMKPGGRKKLMKALSDLFYRETRMKFDRYISKKEIARNLSLKRAAEIRNEMSEDTYEPKWEIEKELIKICEIFFS